MFDVLPDGALDSLTAEDLRLLLNGVGDINVATLISYTTFNDESNEQSDKLVKFKRWLWSIVEKMSNVERQDLVSFLAFCYEFIRELNFSGVYHFISLYVGPLATVVPKMESSVTFNVEQCIL